jgi:hypothetical protein
MDALLSFTMKAQEFMAIERDHAKPSEAPTEGAASPSGKSLWEIVGFVASLVSFAAIGAGILPNSTAMEKFLVAVAAVALSCAFWQALKVVPRGRTAAWLGAFSATAVICLAALSLVVQDASAPSAASAASQGTGTQGGATPLDANPTGSATAVQGATVPQSGTQPSKTASATVGLASPSYTLDYRNQPFHMTGGACQYSGDQNDASGVNFTQETPASTTNAAGNTDAIDTLCTGVFGPGASLMFSNQTAEVTGTPTPAQCDADITTGNLVDPSNGIAFGQLKVGDEFCFIAGGGTAGPLVLAVLTSVSQSTFDTAWAATAWQVPSSS